MRAAARDHHPTPLPPSTHTQITTFAGAITAALGPNIFTDIAFENPTGHAPPGTDVRRRLFVASASGAVFEIDYGA